MNKGTIALLAIAVAAMSVTADAQQNRDRNKPKPPHGNNKYTPGTFRKPGVYKRTGLPAEGGREATPRSFKSVPVRTLSVAPVGHPAPVVEKSHYTFNNVRASSAQYAVDARRYTIQVNKTVVVNNIYQSPQWGGHWRYGYVSRPGLSINFNFGSGVSAGLYVATPFAAPCVPSPWYYYPTVPAYVPTSRVYIVPSYTCGWGIGVNYAYNPGLVWSRYGDPDLNRAVDAIRAMFQQHNLSLTQQLVDPNDRVAIFSEGNYEYSLAGTDFQQMLADNVQATPTVQLRITGVRVNGDIAVVHATHFFSLPNGATDQVYQQYRLIDEGGNYVITDFMTSHLPI